MQLAFGDYVLDRGRRELRRGSEQVALEPQVFDVLLYLALNRNRVVSKDDLIAAVWNGRIISDSPSRPGEFHPEPLTEPDLNLSIHPARAIA